MGARHMLPSPTATGLGAAEPQPPPSAHKGGACGARVLGVADGQICCARRCRPQPATRPARRPARRLVSLLAAATASITVLAPAALAAPPPPTHSPAVVARVRSYLRFVYPAARARIDAYGAAELTELFESLDYYYACDPARAALFIPPAPCSRISAALGAGGAPPPLPYVPRGVFYSVEPRELSRPSRKRRVWLGASFTRWRRPVVHADEADASRTRALRLFSAFALLYGPQPSWTSVSAVVRYVWWPVGMRAGDVRRVLAAARRRALEATGGGGGGGGDARKAHAFCPSRAVWRLDQPALPLPLRETEATRAHAAAGGLAGRLRRLRALRDGDLVEVEQLGGPVWRPCPPTCGTWANVWRGTGVFMRVSAPFVSLSKATAIAEMLMEIDQLELSGARTRAPLRRLEPSRPPAARVGPRLAELARRLRLSEALQRSLERFPSARAGEALAAAALVSAVPPTGPCGGTAGGMMLGTAKQQRDLSATYNRTAWVQAARAGELAPGAVVDHLLLRAPGMAADPAVYDMHWLHGVCGEGALRATGATDYAFGGWDALLAALACFLGVHTLVLGASPNDNGLLHQELVDFEAGGASAWPKRRLAAGGALEPLGALDECIVPYGRARPPPPPPELAAHWAASGKFVLAAPAHVRPVRASRAPTLPLPCAMFGARNWSAAAIAACSWAGLFGPLASAEACHVWCDGAMSQAHSTVPARSVLGHARPTTRR